MNKDIILHGIGRKDWTKGSIVPEVRVPSGDWTPYLCNYQQQKYKFDTNECAQLSTINICETQCNYLKATKQFSDEAIKWFTDNGYFDENGRFDFSERFTATLAGCSIYGSSQWWAWQAIDNYGLLPWKDFNYSEEESDKFDNQSAMCDDYYDKTKITQAMKDKAIQVKKYLKFEYEWLINNGKPQDDLVDDLKHSPIGVGVPVCSYMGWNSTNPPACVLGIAHHAVMLFKQENGANVIWDQYQPAIKALSPGYEVYLATKGVVSPAPINKFKHTFYIDLQVGDQGNEVALLQTALIEAGYDIPAITSGKAVKGYYGVQTQSAVFEFQKKYVANSMWSGTIVWFNKGRYCSALTRAALNKIFA